MLFTALTPTPWKSKHAQRSFSEVGSTPTAAKAMVGGPGRGDPQTVIVGLPDAAVKESKDRVNTAILNSGFEMPKDRLTINLAPADIKKEGPIFHVVPDLDRGQVATYSDSLARSGMTWRSADCTWRAGHDG